ncbi:hypothetical protein [Sphingomonas sp.]|uniref:hypothetical protein n=1 Tax=Sphingomonas sp. TaxID=28214 RepID=UPI003D6CA113
MTWLAFGFLGFLIGNLTGLSASPIASVLIPTLFTLFGGSLLAYFSKLDEALRIVSSRCLAAFSLACLIGVYCGIAVNARQMLGPPPFQSVAASSR